MNIIRVENVKSSLATTYSLTLTVEKYKDLNKEHTIVVLNEEDIKNTNTLLKLRGVNINILMIPKKYKFSFNETDYFKMLEIQLDENYKVTYY